MCLTDESRATHSLHQTLEIMLSGLFCHTCIRHSSCTPRMHCNDLSEICLPRNYFIQTLRAAIKIIKFNTKHFFIVILMHSQIQYLCVQSIFVLIKISHCMLTINSTGISKSINNYNYYHCYYYHYYLNALPILFLLNITLHAHTKLGISKSINNNN